VEWGGAGRGAGGQGAGMGARRDKPGRSRAAGYVMSVLLVGLVVAVWAMGAKPS